MIITRTTTTINANVKEGVFVTRETDEGMFCVSFEHGVGGRPLIIGTVETAVAADKLIDDASDDGFYCENRKVWRKSLGRHARSAR